MQQKTYSQKQPTYQLYMYIYTYMYMCIPYQDPKGGTYYSKATSN